MDKSDTSQSFSSSQTPPVGANLDAKRIIPVVMCGGAGTRLWPVSREAFPKQFIPVIGERSTFQQVFDLDPANDLFASPIVITNSDFRFIVAEQLRELG